MSAGRNPKEYIAPYEMLGDWDEVLLGDEELFKEMTEPHLSTLLHAARRSIKPECKRAGLQPDFLQPEELVGETLIQAWQARHGRTERRPLKEWLLEVQAHTLRRMIEEEKKLYEPIAVSLEEPVPFEAVSSDENEFWDWIEPPVRDRWEDVIPDERTQSLVA
jgi:RNA polymerase sigma-70 factor (ECF subfamily)